MVPLRIIRPKSQNLDYISNHNRNERFVITFRRQRVLCENRIVVDRAATDSHAIQLDFCNVFTFTYLA